MAVQSGRRAPFVELRALAWSMYLFIPLGPMAVQEERHTLFAEFTFMRALRGLAGLLVFGSAPYGPWRGGVALPAEFVPLRARSLLAVMTVPGVFSLRTLEGARPAPR